jgi:hypothetical protein
MLTRLTTHSPAEGQRPVSTTAGYRSGGPGKPQGLQGIHERGPARQPQREPMVERLLSVEDV